MSVQSTVTDITTQTMNFAPAVIGGIQAAEAAGASGENKKQAVIDGILAGAKAAENIPVPQVAAIAGMIDLAVSIFNSLGRFKHAPAPVPTNK